MSAVTIKGDWNQVIAALQSKVTKIQPIFKENQEYSVSVTKSYAPVRTGRLKEEITGKMQDEYSFTLSSPTPYAKFVNDGTSRHKANPYFDRGVLDTWNKLNGDLRNALR